MIPKFRAWGRDWNYPGTPSEKFEMFYDVSVVTTFHHKEQHVIADFGMYNESEYNGTEIIDYTLMQSTGLLDINGKEIFEGDVVRVDDYKNIVVKFGKIEHEENYGDIVIYQGLNLYLGGGYPEAVMSKHEIIGNVYENPELLEE